MAFARRNQVAQSTPNMATREVLKWIKCKRGGTCLHTTSLWIMSNLCPVPITYLFLFGTWMVSGRVDIEYEYEELKNWACFEAFLWKSVKKFVKKLKPINLWRVSVPTTFNPCVVLYCNWQVYLHALYIRITKIIDWYRALHDNDPIKILLSISIH